MTGTAMACGAGTCCHQHARYLEGSCYAPTDYRGGHARQGCTVPMSRDHDLQKPVQLGL
jgi:hypothetical protein